MEYKIWCEQCHTWIIDLVCEQFYLCCGNCGNGLVKIEDNKCSLDEPEDIEEYEQDN
jgi:hypothetical protein